MHHYVGGKRLSGGGLKVCCLNINSLLEHIDQLRIFREEHKPHVLCLNETKLDSTVMDNDLTIECFHLIFRKDHDRHGGGVATYMRNEIKFLQREDMKTDFESLTVEIDIQYVKPILVTTIYRRPDSLVEMFDKIDGLLCKLESENKESIIAGDMNCNLTLFRPCFFYRLKVQGRVFSDPLYDLRNHWS